MNPMARSRSIVCGIGRLGEPDRRRAVPELLLHERDGERIGEVGGEDEDVRLLALDGRANVVERRDERGLHSFALEHGVDADRGLDVLQRDAALSWRRRLRVICRGTPRTIATACSTIGSSAASPSRTPLVEPGRLTMSVLLRMPASPRASAALGLRLNRQDADPLGDPRRLAVEHRPGRLGGDVGGTQPGPARREDQIGLVAVGPGGQGGDDLGGVVRDDSTPGHGVGPARDPRFYSVPRPVNPLTAGRSRGDCQDGNLHLPNLRVPGVREKTSPWVGGLGVRLSSADQCSFADTARQNCLGSAPDSPTRSPHPCAPDLTA